jgi:uncharacterized membrane protein
MAAQPAAGPGNRIINVIDDRVTVARPRDVHPSARAEFDEGDAAPDTRMDRMVLVLAPDAKQQEELDELIAAQRDPESAEYRRWLTPAAFGSRFGVSAADLDRIVSWLRSHGFTVEPVSPAGTSIVFSGSVGQVAAAFHTAIHIYNVNGKRHFANASAPEIPEALAEVVAGVVSLHDFHAAPWHRVAGPIAARYAAPLFADSAGNHYLAPADFATIYDASSLYTNSVDGTGQSIAIVGRTNINTLDVQFFRNYFGLPANNPTIVLNGADPGIVSGEETEAVLDVEWSGAAAPKAAIQLVVSASTNSSDGAALSAQYIVNQNLAPVASASFGSCELDMGASENQFWNALWQQAAAQGITVLVASGDSGVAGCDADSSSAAVNPAGVNGLCSSPFSTCVGGTEFNDKANPSAYWTASGSASSYIPETAWNESGSVSGGADLLATGGGSSMIYQKPAWQTGPGVPSDGWRDVPDVALSAAGHDGYVVYMNGNFYAVGGTSAAAPSFAGLMALAAQETGGWLGSVNPTLYSLAANQASGGGAVFHDVTAGNNTVPGLVGFSAGPGYDLTTGLGSVDAAQLIKHWNDAPVSGTFHLTASPASVSLVTGAHATVGLQLTVSTGFNSPVALSANGLPSGLTASFSTATLTVGSPASTLTLTAGVSPPFGAHTVTIAAAGGSIVRYVPVAVNISACTYAISPTSAAPPGTAASYTVSVTAAAGCSWTAASNSNWITISSGGSGSGSGTVNYSVAANAAASSRSGSIAIAGLTLTVTQAAAAFSLNALNANYSAAAAAGSVTVTPASSPAYWTAVSNAAWIAITSGGANTAAGTVNYSVAANTAATARNGTMTIAGLTFTVTQAAAAPGFTLNATPSSLTIAAGSSVTVAIGVASVGGFQGAVTLIPSGFPAGLPAGVTAAFTPTAIAPGGAGTLTLTAAASAPSFSGAVSFTGVSGSVMGTLPLGLAVTAVPGFTLGAPSSVALVAGTSANTTVEVAAIGSFTGNVTLAVSGLPAGVTAVFAPTPVAAGGTAALMLTATASASVASSNLTLTGASGSLHAAVPLSLNVTVPPGFTLLATPTSMGIARGASATASITVSAVGSFAGRVTLAISALPTGVTAAFSPTAVAAGGSSTLNLTAASWASVGSTNLTITGTGEGLTGTLPIGLGVTATGFTLSANPESVAVLPGASATTAVSVAANGAFAGNVSLAVAGLPVGVTAAFSPTAVAAGGTATLRLTAAASAAPSSGSIVLTGSSGSLTSATPLPLAVTGFTLSPASPALTLAAGSSVNTGISVVGAGGFTGSVTLAVSGLPAGVTASLAPVFPTPGETSTLTLVAAASAAASSPNITLTGTSGSLTGTAKIALNVTAAPGVSLSPVSTSLTLVAGSSVATAIGVAGSHGFTGNVALAVSGLPAGVTATFTPASAAVGGNSTLKLAAAASTVASSVNLTLMGSSGSVTGTAAIALKVTPAPGFTLTAAPSALTEAAGASATTTISVAGTGGFTGTVALAVSGLPAGVTATFTPASAAVGGTSTLKVTAASSAPVFSGNFTLTGSSGSLTGTAPVALSVTPAPGFTLTATPSSMAVMAGSSATTSISVAGTGGFTGTVALAVSGLPAGVTATFTPASAAGGGTSTLKLTAASSAPVFSGNFTLTGSSGSAAGAATIGLSVTLNIAPGFTLSLAPPALTVGLTLSASTTVRCRK